MNLESGNSSEVNFERFWTKSVQPWTKQFYGFYIQLTFRYLQKIRNEFEPRRLRIFLFAEFPSTPLSARRVVKSPEALT